MAVPDMAASTCNHRLCWRQTLAISLIGSMAFEEVVPTVAQTKEGTDPARLSSAICRARALGFIANLSLTSISRRFELPIPAIIAAFCSDECVCVEAYATMRPLHPAALLA